MFTRPALLIFVILMWCHMTQLNSTVKRLENLLEKALEG
jgi:hypothetical protein